MRLLPASKRERVPDVDMTPMIDVVFLLIVFFMTTAQFARMTKAEVDLPREQGQERAREGAGAIIINVTRDGGIVVESERVQVAELLRMVAVEAAREGGAERLDLVIRADHGASAGVVNAIAEGLADMGVRSWRLATAPTSGIAP